MGCHGYQKVVPISTGLPWHMMHCPTAEARSILSLGVQQSEKLGNLRERAEAFHAGLWAFFLVLSFSLLLHFLERSLSESGEMASR